MKERWTCKAQRYMVRYFPNASQRIKLPKWMWRRLCAAECTEECQTSCPGCAEMAPEWEQQAAAAVVSEPAGEPAQPYACSPTCGCREAALEASGADEEQQVAGATTTANV